VTQSFIMDFLEELLVGKQQSRGSVLSEVPGEGGVEKFLEKYDEGIVEFVFCLCVGCGSNRVREVAMERWKTFLTQYPLFLSPGNGDVEVEGGVGTVLLVDRCERCPEGVFFPEGCVTVGEVFEKFDDDVSVVVEEFGVSFELAGDLSPREASDGSALVLLRDFDCLWFVPVLPAGDAQDLFYRTRVVGEVRDGGWIAAESFELTS